MIRALAALTWLACLLPGAALAQSTPCAARIEAWVHEAAEAIGTRAEAESCPPGMVRVRLFPEATAPLDVEVAEPPGPAFRRAGSLRTSPIVEVNDYEDLPAPQRAAYEALVVWLERNEARVVLRAARTEAVAGMPNIEGVGFVDVGWWLVIAALALIALGLTRDRPRSVEWRTAAVIAALAGALRAAFGVWGPLHVNGQGPLWILGALVEPARLASYGPGYAELFGPVARASAEPDTAIFAANVVLGAVTCSLLFAVARLAGLERNRAVFAALLLALTPAAVRLTASEGYFTVLAALALGSTCAVVLAARSLARRRWLAAAALLAGAGLLAAQAARVHPVGWIPLALVPLAAALPGRPRGLGGRVVAVLVAGVALALALLLTSGGWIAAVLSSATAEGQGPRLSGAIAAGTFGRDAVIALLLAAPALFVARPRAPVLVALPSVVVAVATWRIYGQSAAWASAYVTLYVPMAALGLAALLPRRTRLVTAAGLAGATTAAVLWVSAPYLLSPTTEQLEHTFLRRQLPRLDPSCRLAYLERADRRIDMVPTWAHPGTERPLRVDDPADLEVAAARGCVYWVHTALCSSGEARDRCRAIEQAVPLTPVATTHVPARPSYDGFPYDADPIQITIYRTQ